MSSESDYDTLDLVLTYLDNGLGVFPLHTWRNGLCTCMRADCRSPAKHPVLRPAHRKDDPRRGTCQGECGRPGHGVYDATLDRGQVAEWFARFPGCNWGGSPPPGVIVVDVDPRHRGDVSLQAMWDEHGVFPRTLTAETGSGGRHYWLLHDGPARGRIGEGLDVKKAGGYLVLPPSLHASGNRYRWTDQSEAAAAPRWLRLKLNPPTTRAALSVKGKGGKLDGLVGFVAAAPEGQRNSRVSWAFYRALTEDPDRDVTPLIDAAESVGLARDEIHRTLQSAQQKIAPHREAASP